MDRDKQNVTLGGREYVIVPREDFERLTSLAKAADLPAMPKADASGNFPAAEYARASLARKIIKARAESGLTQRALAKLAGISFEHVCRIEGGKHTPSVATIAKIERALKQTTKPSKASKGR